MPLVRVRWSMEKRRITSLRLHTGRIVGAISLTQSMPVELARTLGGTTTMPVHLSDRLSVARKTVNLSSIAFQLNRFLTSYDLHTSLTMT